MALQRGDDLARRFVDPADFRVVELAEPVDVRLAQSGQDLGDPTPQRSGSTFAKSAADRAGRPAKDITPRLSLGIWIVRVQVVDEQKPGLVLVLPAMATKRGQNGLRGFRR